MVYRYTVITVTRKIIRLSVNLGHEIRAANTAGWPYKENSADTSNKMIVTLLNSKKSLPQKLVGKIVSAKDYRQESIAAKIPDNASYKCKRTHRWNTINYIR